MSKLKHRGTSRGRMQGTAPAVDNLPRDRYTDDTRPDWTRECEVCGQTPVVPMTGMCGPCTFGEAETIGGNW